MKKKWMAIGLAAALLMISIPATFAYFTTSDVATNVITAGNIEIDLIEMAQTAGGLKPFEDATGVMPGAQVSKIVTVKNTGGNDAYVRISVSKQIQLAKGVTGTPDLTLVSMDINTKDWTLRDGYYYYNEALEAGEETAPLFTNVTFSKDMGNMYQSSTAIVEVNAQATQVVHNGNSALEAAGWPAK